jgi:hypothetical protein
MATGCPAVWEKKCFLKFGNEANFVTKKERSEIMESEKDQARTCRVCEETKDVPDLMYVGDENDFGVRSGWYCPECLPEPEH